MSSGSETPSNRWTSRTTRSRGHSVSSAGVARFGSSLPNTSSFGAGGRSRIAWNSPHEVDLAPPLEDVDALLGGDHGVAVEVGGALHNDSLGSEALLRPGGVNVMTAGSGIAHAERTPAANSSPP